MKKTVYIFRHGETDWNAQLRWQGHSDIPLNETGRNQAKALIPLLKDKKIEAIFSSDLSRAIETSKIVNEHLKVPIFASPDLREVNLGIAEGLTNEEVIQKVSQRDLERWRSVLPSDNNFGFSGGETKNEALRRNFQALEEFLKANTYSVIGVASHGGIIRRMMHYLLPHLTEPVLVANCALFTLIFDAQARQWIAREEDCRA
jgi:broad specificity phosphatase PhoE